MSHLILGAAALLSACVSDPPESCMLHSDCQDDGKAGVCAANGFCQRECNKDLDCPCGSFCASGCGVCIINDLAGPATCFADRWGLRPDTVVAGACRTSDPATSTQETDSGEVERMCAAEKLRVPVCEDASASGEVDEIDDDAGEAQSSGVGP